MPPLPAALRACERLYLRGGTQGGLLSGACVRAGGKECVCVCVCMWEEGMREGGRMVGRRRRQSISCSQSGTDALPTHIPPNTMPHETIQHNTRARAGG